MDISICSDTLPARYGAKKAYDLLAKAGFTAIDWSLYEYEWKEGEKNIFEYDIDYIIDYFTPELNAIKEAGLRIALAHAPFPSYKLDDPDFTDYCIECYKKVIMLCEHAGCPNLVIHGISHQLKNPVSFKVIEEANMHLYTSLIPTLLKTNVKVCLENLFTRHEHIIFGGICADALEARHWVDCLNKVAERECFAFCMDNGHLNLTNTQPRHFIEVMGKRIQALHLHDNSGNDDNHALPFTGKSDWDGIVGGLAKVGYSGAINFEVGVTDMEDSVVLPALRYLVACGQAFAKQIESEGK